MFRTFLPILFCLFCLAANAQTFVMSLPAEPAVSLQPAAARKVPGFFASKVNRSLVAAEFGVRTVDAVSTWRLRPDNCDGCREDLLPQSWASHLGIMLPYNLGVASAYSLAAVELSRHHHRKLARGVLIFDIGYDGALGTSNILAKNPPPPPVGLLPPHAIIPPREP